MSDKWLFTLAAIGQELGVSRQQVWRLVHSGRLPAVKVGRLWVVTRVNLERMKAARAGLEAAKSHPMVRRRK